MKQTLKVIIAFATNLGLRLIPFRPANVEPIMATLMPMSKSAGAVTGAFFAFASMYLHDAIQGKVGTWTWVTACVYALIGIAAGEFFRKHEASRLNFVAFSFVSTIVYDALTGLTIGPIFYGQSLYGAFLSQIPFTITHLVGNTLFAALLSPLIYSFFVKNPALDIELTLPVRKQPAS